jgi:exonuclease III
MFLGGWNVRSCFRRAKKELIIKQIKKHRIEMAALSETAMYDSGITKIDDYTMIFSGVTSENKTRSAHGVAVCLNKQATRVWKDSGSVWEAVTERIIMVRLGGKPIYISLIAVYAPTNPLKGQNAAMDESDTFYINLQETVDKVPKGDMLLIVGDFNARVGKQDNQGPGNVIGQHTVDSTNENGKRLIDFCSLNNLIVTNTFFQHKPMHQTSWMHPGKKVWHMLDYTLVNRKFRSSVEDVRVHRTAAGAIGTDHHLLRTKVKIHLRSRRKNQHPKRIRLDFKKLRDEKLLEAFQKDIEEKRKEATNVTMTIDEKYANFVEYVKRGQMK